MFPFETFKKNCIDFVASSCCHSILLNLLTGCFWKRVINCILDNVIDWRHDDSTLVRVYEFLIDFFQSADLQLFIHVFFYKTNFPSHTNIYFLCVCPKIRLTGNVTDDVDEDPTGNKALWDRGLLNGAAQKAGIVANFHVGEICMSLQVILAIAVFVSFYFPFPFQFI